MENYGVAILINLATLIILDYADMKYIHIREKFYNENKVLKRVIVTVLLTPSYAVLNYLLSDIVNSLYLLYFSIAIFVFSLDYSIFKSISKE